MKAAILHKLGEAPKYGDFKEPQISHDDEVVVTMKAASIKNIDRGRANGTHYDKHTELPTVPGVDGVGVLPDSTRVYTGFGNGMIAEKSIVHRHRCIPIPDSIDDVTAAALPNPGLSAWFSLAYRAAIKQGDKVLILGATGVTGKVAIQLAKILGAGRVVATGRNTTELAKLPALGADAIISLVQTEEEITAALREEAREKPFDIVIDYLWGRPAELVLHMLSGHDLNKDAHITRYVQVGDMAGKTLNLYAGILRSAAIELYGIGGGSVPKEIMKKVPTEILPMLIKYVAEGTLKIETQAVALADVEQAWIRGDQQGRRVVVVM